MFRWSGSVLLAGMAAAGLTLAQGASGAVGDGTAEALVETVGQPGGQPNRAVDLQLRFIQEGGPESGQVRVVVTPETRRLTILEARSAAQQAFLQALNEPGLGDNLRRVTVVVRRLPDSHPDPGGAEQVIRFQLVSGRDWSVMLGE